MQRVLAAVVDDGMFQVGLVGCSYAVQTTVKIPQENRVMVQTVLQLFGRGSSWA